MKRVFSTVITQSKLYFTAQHYQEWANVIKDYNPIHDCSKIDLTKPPIPKVIIPGKLSFFPFTQLIAQCYPKFSYQTTTMRFKAPIFFHEEVKCKNNMQVEVKLNEIQRSKDIIKLEGRITKDNKLCILFQATITI